MLKIATTKATTIKILASTVLVGGAVSVAGLGTFGAFTSTTTATQAVDSGTITLSLNGKKEGNEDLGSVGGMVPGDSFQRKINLARGADDEKFGSLEIKTTTTSTKGAGADLVKQLRATVRTCSVPWTLENKTLQCGTTAAPGTITEILTDQDVFKGVTLPRTMLDENLNSASRQLNLGVTFTFQSTGDDAADNKLQDAAADLSFQFVAHQRTGTNL